MPSGGGLGGSATTLSCGNPERLRVTWREHSTLTGASCAVLYCGIHKDFIKHVSLSRRGAPKFHRPEKQLETNYQGAIRLIHIYKVEPCRGTLGLRTAFPS